MNDKEFQERFHIPLAEIINGVENFGIYITDKDRKIIYWNRAAERIMGYRSSDVVGKSCHDNILCHIDRHGRKLCDSHICPLYQSIHRDQANSLSIFVFGKHVNGKRIPLAVSVSPVRDAAGEIMGGIEVFRDGTQEFHQLQLAQAVQTRMMPSGAELAKHWPVAFGWVPAEMIGGDLVSMFPRTNGRLMGLVTDVSGHGVASALVTSFIWKMMTDVRETALSPSRILKFLADCWTDLHITSHYFSAQCFEFDPKTSEVVISSGGHPLPLLVSPDGKTEFVEVNGDLIGLFEGPQFEEVTVNVAGKRLYFYSDGMVEGESPSGEILGDREFTSRCREANALALPEVPSRLIRSVLDYSGSTEPKDDLTLIVLQGVGFDQVSGQ